MSDKQIKLLYVGRISKDKNLDFLVDVYRQLRELHPDISLTFAGVGPYLQELRNECLHLAGVNFSGRVPYHELPQLYNQHDLFLFPSVTDTFGMVVLEAQACGLPALVSNVGGPNEIVRDGETGYVLPVETPQPWVDKISELLTDISSSGSLRQRLGIAARIRVETQFNWDTILHDMVKPDPAGVSRLHQQRQKSSLKRLFKLASNMMVH